MGEQLARSNTELTRTVALLHAEVEHRQRLEAALLTATEEERQRLGQDLHDDLCQHLAKRLHLILRQEGQWLFQLRGRRLREIPIRRFHRQAESKCRALAQLALECRSTMP